MARTKSLVESVVTLGASESVNGTSHPTADYVGFLVLAASDQAGTLKIQQSSDGTTWCETDSVAVAADTPKRLRGELSAAHVRVRYENGSTPQGSFELLSYLVDSGGGGAAATGGGGGATTIADGDDAALGATTSAESASGNGTAIGLLKRLRTLLGGGLPAALSGGGNLKAAVSEALPAGTNNIGDVDVASIAAGDNNIGNVDVLTEPATAADGAAGLPTLLKLIAGWDGVNVQAVSVNSSGELVTTATFTETATAADGAAALPAVLKVIAGWDGTNVQAIKTDADGNLQVEILGTPTVAVAGTADTNLVSVTTGRGKVLIHLNVNQGAAGTTVIRAAVPGNKLKVISYALTLSADGTLKFTDGTADLVGPFDFAAKGGIRDGTDSGDPVTETQAVNRPLNLVTTGGAARGRITLIEEA